MDNCLFCKMMTGEVSTNKIYEDDRIFVIKDIRPKARVHLLVIPKIHLDNLNDAKEEHCDLLGYMMISLKNFAKEQGIDSFRTIINTGMGSGQEIYHLHIHLLGGGPLPAF